MRLFLVQENLILLGGALLFSLALASPVPALAAVTGELVWLVLGASSSRLQRWVDARGNAAVNVTGGPAPAVAADTLDAEHARRVQNLDRAIATIRTFGGQQPQASFDRAIALLETLPGLYRGLSENDQQIGLFLAATSEAELEAETERLKQQFGAEKDLGVRLTLRQAMTAAQRRLDRRRSMAQLRRGIRVKLDSAERSITYFLSQGRALASNAGFRDDVEALLSELGPALVIDTESVRPPSVAPA